ncbi:MAG: hypothetical protein JWP88_1094 [Flaviaesturariibacter sp.]|nr:hypothetical protein [Flaviaesturariibacter sp.]
MNALRKNLGIVWMFAGPAAALFLVVTAVKYISQSAKGDIGNPVPWIIIIAIFMPIAIGLTIFGWYCWKGEYDREK